MIFLYYINSKFIATNCAYDKQLGLCISDAFTTFYLFRKKNHSLPKK